MTPTAFPVSVKGVVVRAIGVASRHVFIETYGCRLDTDAQPVMSGEHREPRLFGLDETARLRMPAGYRRSVASWFVRHGT